MSHRTTEELLAGIDHIREAPDGRGTVEMIVVRPSPQQREVLDEAAVTKEDGVVGDNWKDRVDDLGMPNSEAQVTVMNARYTDLIADDRDSWPLAGDQFYVDYDLGVENLPAGSRFRIGSAVLEISVTPHTGCASFSRRFGADALRFVNSEIGRQLRLRGVNALVVEPGQVRLGDTISKV